MKATKEDYKKISSLIRQLLTASSLFWFGGFIMSLAAYIYDKAFYGSISFFFSAIITLMLAHILGTNFNLKKIREQGKK